MDRIQFQSSKAGKTIQPANSSTKSELSLCLKGKNSYEFLSSNSFLPSVSAAADFIPCSPSTVRLFQKLGILRKYTVIPGRYIFLKKEVQNAIRKNKRLRGLRLKNLLRKLPCHCCKTKNQ